ncbi:MAG: hypothetical protein ABL893_17170, partial [Hyphomicrobium sp.]
MADYMFSRAETRSVAARLVRASVSAFALAAVLSSVALPSVPAFADGGNTFFDTVRNEAGTDQLITKDEFKALVPPNAYSEAEWSTFFARADSYGITAAGTQNLHVERLVDMIVAENARQALNQIVGDKTTPITLSDVNLALPAGIMPGKVTDFLLSIPRTEGGAVTREAAEQALYEFVGRDGNTGYGEDGRHVAPIYYPNLRSPIETSATGTAPVRAENGDDINAHGRPAISARSGYSECDFIGESVVCTPSGNGGTVSVDNYGTLHSWAEPIGSTGFGPVATGINATSLRGAVNVTN